MIIIDVVFFDHMIERDRVVKSITVSIADVESSL